jgi:hypothetical protein
MVAGGLACLLVQALSDKLRKHCSNFGSPVMPASLLISWFLECIVASFSPFKWLADVIQAVPGVKLENFWKPCCSFGSPVIYAL